MRKPRETLASMTPERREELREAYRAHRTIIKAARALGCPQTLVQVATLDMRKPRRKVNTDYLISLRMACPVWEVAERTGLSKSYLNTQFSIWKKLYDLKYPKFPARKSGD